jgi:hypothetical protein
MQNLPRQIDPSLIQTGDTITVVYPKDSGITSTIAGRVARLRYGGPYTHYDTREGGTILTWRAGDRSGIKVILNSREEITQTPMFGMDEIRERIS